MWSRPWLVEGPASRILLIHFLSNEDDFVLHSTSRLLPRTSVRMYSAVPQGLATQRI